MRFVVAKFDQFEGQLEQTEVLADSEFEAIRYCALASVERFKDSYEPDEYESLISNISETSTLYELYEFISEEDVYHAIQVH